jgi:hypothetical protein
VAEPFHRRGHHVQKAHGRRAAMASDGSHLSGGMIALMPTAEDAKRLALPGGEKAADLHCTLFFLGDDGSVWTDDQRNALEEHVRMAVADLPEVQANVFGVAHWNGKGEQPSWVWNVGDDPESGAHLGETRALAGVPLMMGVDLPELPEQHSPWAAHICAAYTDDLTLVRALEKRLGPVTFDRIRLSFGDDDRDIPLGAGALTASALRRDPLPHEESTDFAEHNRQWEGAVASTTNRMISVYSAWRTGLWEQIKAGADTPEELTGLTLDPTQAEEVLAGAMLDLARRAGQSLQREAEKQGVEIPEWGLPDDTVTAAVGGRRLLGSVARMTADLLSASVLQAAKRTVTGLFTRDAPPDQIATEVDKALADAQDSLLKGPVSTAMSTAQTAGRQAVLEVAPPGEYYASEMLDRNTCGPCRAVDGEQFGSLEIAIKAYPVMGYKDCVGPRYGNSCRGLIVAHWTPEEDAVTAGAEALHGTPGRPSYRNYHPSGRNKKQKGKIRHAQGGWIGSDRFTEAEHEDALLDYQGRAYRDVNAYLRSGTEPKRNSMEEVHSVTSRLSDLISLQDPSSAERTVYRGTRQIRIGLRPGDEFHDRGFMSTAGDRDVAESMTGVGGSLFVIRSPSGTQSLDMAALGADAGEAEHLFPPGTKMRVLSADEPEDGLKTAVYEVEIING